MPVKDDLKTLEAKVADLINWIAESSLEDKASDFPNADLRTDTNYSYYDFFDAIHTDILKAMETKEKEIEGRKQLCQKVTHHHARLNRLKRLKSTKPSQRL